MIIPIRCFTCNRVLASKYEAYLKMIEQPKSSDVLEEKQQVEENILTGNPDIDLNKETKHQEIFKKLGIDDRYCCKRMILCNADLL